MPRSLPALTAAALAALAMVAALAFAAGTPSTTFGMKAMPATGPPGVLPSVVLEGASPRPARDFALRSTNGGRTVGTASASWSPHGDGVCPQAAVPLGRDGTDLRVEIDTDQPFAGGISGRLYTPHAACDRAVGVWHGTSGDFAGRDGGLVVALEDDGLVRLVFSP